MKLHPNTERCIRLDIARLLVVMNLEEPLLATIQVRGSGESISVSYPWLPPRCLGCQKWGHTDKTCLRNKHIKEKDEVVKEKENGLTPGSEVANEALKSIDIENLVLEAAHMATVEARAQSSSTKDSGGDLNETDRAGNLSCDSVSDKVTKTLKIPENEEQWSTVPQSSPSGRRNNGKSARGTELEGLSTSSPSRFHLLTTELEEGEVEAEDESSSSEEESSVESKMATEKRKQMEKQRIGKNKKHQKSTAIAKKDQPKEAKNKQINHVSSRRH